MAIATLYEGIEYRSRLEARWAAFFTNIGWKHTYEPFDGDGYIPDFLIQGPAKLLVEVKPAAEPCEYRAPIAKIEAGVRNHWQADILIVGVNPMPWETFTWGTSHPAIGVIGEYQANSWAPDTHGGWAWGDACWLTCDGQCCAKYPTTCGRLGVFSEINGWASRPCGHYCGDHHMGWPDKLAIRDAWASACNRVKWQGRDAA